ncbi:MAG: riboflavin kinase, partial [Acidimicrobiales bacterium]
STRIRQLLAGGSVEAAAALLGRPHEVRGGVERGDGRGGAVLGYPTANVAVPEEILVPGEGVYAGWYERPGGAVHAAAVSVGRRPTFYDDGPSGLEAHLLDFDGDLYGEPARVRFVARLRDDRQFDTTDDLVAEMDRDVARARSVLTLPLRD